MTTESTEPLARLSSAKRVEPKFGLGDGVFFNVPLLDDPSGIEFGSIIGRQYKGSEFLYDIDTGDQWYFNVKESFISPIEKLTGV